MNNHLHHQLQDQVVGSSSSATPSYYGGVCTTPHAWGTTPTSFLNTNNGFTSYPSEPILNPARPQENTLLSSQYNADMPGPDLAFHNWANYTNTTNYSNDHQSLQDLHLPRIKEEFSDHYYHKYADLLNNNNNEQQNDFGTKMLLKSLSSENLMSYKNINNQISSGNFIYGTGVTNNGRGFAQILPSINVSNLNNMGLANGAAGSSLDMNLEALDLLTSSSFSGNLGTSSQNHQVGSILRDGFSNYASFDDHMQQSNQIPFYGSNNKISSSPINNGAVEAKRSSSKIEPKASHQNATKKSRVEARASCPPFKVRKEKLGDRIAALQQMVAPFGKTDTASVLMEAIGYIKFLQDQVETLSVPYMKASRNKSSRIKAGHADHQNEKDEESKRDLKSRGLCLVPLSCLSYITDGGAATVWPPPHFGGPT
ncbi:hypothetical protein CASFOL_015876 [Castilleja foliolosa]|uniref:BHLH domain-containing protein n=1 Tax=Castilleja foliolosa TaxID=1961234 RepID=A0ABD3DFK9_9LAMI